MALGLESAEAREQLNASRLRMLEAGLEERRRLERNLHDGAQQRLVALALELGLLQERLDGLGDVIVWIADAKSGKDLPVTRRVELSLAGSNC